jgi:hypothetical protein
MKPMNDKHLAILRRHMVELVEIKVELVSDELGQEALSEQVLAAMHRVLRHLFVPSSLASLAYENTPLPIGFDKTISQPFMVALMTDLLAPQRHETCSRSERALATRRRYWQSLRARSGALKSSRNLPATHRCGSNGLATPRLVFASVTVLVGGPSTRHTTRFW